MPNYHACFWSRAQEAIVACDIEGEDGPTLLDRLARAGRLAVTLGHPAPAPSEEPPCFLPTPLELAWLAAICGPAWLYVALNYLFVP